MARKYLTVTDVSRFINDELLGKVTKDLLPPHSKIFRESDLQSCCYYHLRRFLSGDPHWTALNEPWIEELQGRPDLVLCRSGKPKVIIELKFRRHVSGPGKQDAVKLEKITSDPSLALKTFYLEVLLRKTRRTKHHLPPNSRRFTALLLHLKPQKKLTEYLRLFDQFRKPGDRLE